MNSHRERAAAPTRILPEYARVLTVAVVASGTGIALAEGLRAVELSLVPAVLIAAEFTGRWRALAISAVLLAVWGLFTGAPVYPLALIAVAALGCATTIRRGLPLLIPLLLLMVASSLSAWLSGGIWSALQPGRLAWELMEACFNVALVILFVIARPPLQVWRPPTRRWRAEDALFVASAAALVPAAIFLRGDEGVAPRYVMWWAVGAILACQGCIAIAALASERIVRKLRVALEEGRLRSARRRFERVPRELGLSFLAARDVTDHLQRRTAVQGLHLESARLRAGRVQRQLEDSESERRRTQLSLDKSVGAVQEVESRWRTFVNTVPDALFLTDETGRIEYVNEGVKQSLGYEPGSLAGTSISALVPAAQAGRDPLGLTAGVSGGEGNTPYVERNVRFRDSRGALREMNARLRMIQLPEGRRLSIRLREAAGPLQQAQDRFVATMSHEIRTPLHGLMATLDMLRSEELTSAGSRRLSIARTSAKTLMRIANDVLDLSRISAGGMVIERKPMSIQRLIDDVIDETRSREEALRLDVRTEFPGSLPPSVLGDPLRIKQVLRNLLSNALKFTKAGSVTVSTHWSGGICTLDVLDTGVGIPMDRRESIFDAFVQADAASAGRQGGAGLGLSIARQLSEAMGGDLSLVQSGARGSTFRVVLPLQATDDLPLDDQSQRNLPTVRGRILVAEDDEASRYVAQTLLESLECPARIVPNGTEALASLSSEDFDLALLDCEMPGLTGYEVTAKVRQSGGRHIPIIAMTASTMSGDRQRCFDAGMDDMLAKPFGRAALNDMLVKWLTPQPRNLADMPAAQEMATRPDLDVEVFDELRESLNWQLPPLRRIYISIRESANRAIESLDEGTPRDLELAQRRLHSLQGGAGLVGARQIEYVASRLVNALRQGDSKEVSDCLPLLLAASRRFEKVLDLRLDALSAR